MTRESVQSRLNRARSARSKKKSEERGNGYYASMYARMGIPVFPCNARDKSPLTHHGFKDATTNQEMIERWWKRNPNALIGTPNSHLTVVDLDIYKAKGQEAIIIREVFDSVYGTSKLPKTPFVVKTKSGGYHYYYRHDPNSSRKIAAMPYIDILGTGGYVILPDQKTYKFSGDYDSPAFWRALNDLPYIDVEYFLTVRETHKILIDEVYRIMEENKGRRGKPSSRRPDILSTDEAKDALSGKNSLSILEWKSKIKSKETLAKNYNPKDVYGFGRKGSSFTTIQKGLYKKVGSRTEEEYVKFDYDFVNGETIEVEPGDLDHILINAIFHNDTAQAKMARMLNLPVPGKNGPWPTVKNRIPSHADKKPSLGVRWSKDGSRILLRDFSNHANDHNEQNDYNLTRLYVSMKMKRPIGRLSPTEFIVWTTRMYDEAGIISVRNLRREYKEDINTLGEETAKLAEGLLYLDAIKRTNPGYSGYTAFSKSFATIWSGTNPNSYKKMMADLEAKGFIVRADVHNFTDEYGNPSDRNTDLYVLVTKDMKRRPKRYDPDVVHNVNTPFGVRSVRIKGLSTMRNKHDSFMHNMQEVVGDIESAGKTHTKSSLKETKNGRLLVKLFGNGRANTVDPDAMVKSRALTENIRKMIASAYKDGDMETVEKCMSKVEEFKKLAKENKLDMKKKGNMKPGKTRTPVGKAGTTLASRVPVTTVKREPLMDDVTGELYEQHYNPKMGRKALIESVNSEDSPPLSSLVAATMDEVSYRRVVNFLKDIKVEQIPDRENMILPIMISTEYVEQDHTPGEGTVFEGFDLMVVEGTHGRPMLMLYGTSTEALELAHHYEGIEDNLMEPENMGMVISSDIGDAGSDVDLDDYVIKLNHYTKGAIRMTIGPMEHYADEALVRKIEGRSPTIED